MGLGEARLIKKILTESGRFLVMMRRSPGSGGSDLREELVDAMHEEPDAPEPVEEFGDEMMSLMDAAWGDDAPVAALTRRLAQEQRLTLRHRRVTQVHTRRPSDVGELVRPKQPMGDSWRRDLEDALDQLEASPVSESERKRLSRDPGQEEVRALLRQGPQDQAADRADRRLRQGDVDGAIAEYSQAIERNPDHAQPWTKRGIAFARAGLLAEAMEDYTSALEVDPDYLPALANRASAAYHLERFQECIQDTSDALGINPKLAQAWLFRGMSRARTRDGQGAQEDLLQFLQLSPYSPYVTLIRKTLKDVVNWDEDEDEDEDEAESER